MTDRFDLLCNDDGKLFDDRGCPDCGFPFVEWLAPDEADPANTRVKCSFCERRYTVETEAGAACTCPADAPSHLFTCPRYDSLDTGE
jgi:hypothetical protein